MQPRGRSRAPCATPRRFSGTVDSELHPSRLSLWGTAVRLSVSAVPGHRTSCRSFGSACGAFGNAVERRCRLCSRPQSSPRPRARDCPVPVSADSILRSGGSVSGYGGRSSRRSSDPGRCFFGCGAAVNCSSSDLRRVIRFTTSGLHRVLSSQTSGALTCIRRRLARPRCGF